MKVYDTANKLAEELRQSEEYMNFKSLREEINKFPDISKKISEFQRLRYEEQLDTIQMQKRDEEKIKKIQILYTELIENNKVKEYFNAELKFNILLGDVNKIISEAVKDVIV